LIILLTSGFLPSPCRVTAIASYSPYFRYVSPTPLSHPSHCPYLLFSFISLRHGIFPFSLLSPFLFILCHVALFYTICYPPRTHPSRPSSLPRTWSILEKLLFHLAHCSFLPRFHGWLVQH
jgi:hypothetical protein